MTSYMDLDAFPYAKWSPIYQNNGWTGYITKMLWLACLTFCIHGWNKKTTLGNPVVLLLSLIF